MQLDHTIVWSSNPGASARFLAAMLGRPPPVRPGPFEVVALDNGVSLAFMAADGPIQAQHYAFLIDEAEFDAVMGRISQGAHPYWADPYHRIPAAINHHDGGRGVYFIDPDGHDLEVITRPYGGDDVDAALQVRSPPNPVVSHKARKTHQAILQYILTLSVFCSYSEARTALT